MELTSFFRELKKRNIYKVTVVYAITGWVLTQIASVAANTFGAPPWVMKMIITVILLGFPIALIITWAFEVTPDGVQRTQADQPMQQVNEGAFWLGIGLLTVLLFGGWWYLTMETPTNAKSGSPKNITDRSIAVLPFKSVSRSGDRLPLAEGLHDDLLTRLANISDLKVISRTSVEKFEESDLTLPAIADSLGVRWIMEGGVQQMQGKVSINAQLIDPRMDTHIWAQTYERDLTATDLFAIQGEMAREIAEALQAELSAGEQERIAGAPTENLEAYRFYVRGRRLLSQRTETSIQQARSYFEQALKQDSSYALAWSGIADTHMLYAAYSADSSNSFFNSMKTALPKGRKAARRALELDRDLGEAYASLGISYIYQQQINPTQKNGPRALEALKKAVELKPSYAQAHHWLGDLHLTLGQRDPALKHVKLAVDLNPEHRAARELLIGTLLANKKYEEALVEVRLFREMYPNYKLAAIFEAQVLVHLKRWKQVRQTVSQIREPSDWAIAMNAFADIATGDTVSARSRLEQLQTKSSVGGVIPLIQAALGKVDVSFASLQKGYPEEYPDLRAYTLRYLFPDILRPLREDSRYDELIRKINKIWGLNPDGSIPEESK